MQPSNGDSRQIKILKSATSLVPLCHQFPGVKTEKYGYRPIFFNELFFSISLSTVRNIIPLKQDPETKPIFRGSPVNNQKTEYCFCLLGFTVGFFCRKLKTKKWRVSNFLVVDKKEVLKYLQIWAMPQVFFILKVRRRHTFRLSGGSTPSHIYVCKVHCKYFLCL